MTGNDRLPLHYRHCLGLCNCCALELGWSRQNAFAYSNNGRLAAKPSPGDAGDGWGGKHEENEGKARTGKAAGGRNKRLQGGVAGVALFQVPCWRRNRYNDNTPTQNLCGERRKIGWGKNNAYSNLETSSQPCLGLCDCWALDFGWSRQDALVYSNEGRLAAKPSIVSGSMLRRETGSLPKQPSATAGCHWVTQASVSDKAASSSFK